MTNSNGGGITPRVVRSIRPFRCYC